MINRTPLSSYAISAGHDTAAQIAADVLDAGGNAIDAGVAASIALSVLHSEQVQLGGVAPMLIYCASENRTYAIEGAGRWPAATDPTYFDDHHRGRIPVGILRTVIPAAPDAWLTALKRFGTMGFADLAEPAMKLAKEGFPAHEDLVLCTEQFERDYLGFEANAAIWLPGGVPVKLGQTFIQPALGDTLSALRDVDKEVSRKQGRLAGLMAVRDLFYKGDMADIMIRHVKAEGGWMSHSDLAAHHTPVVPATAAKVFGGTLYTCGPWSQGPVYAQALKILEASLQDQSIDRPGQRIHTLLEALKLAFADREAYYGDPDFVDVPLNALLSEAYAKIRTGLIDRDSAFLKLPPAGHRPDYSLSGPSEIEAKIHGAKTLDTSIAAIVDGEGNMFASTPSDQSFDGPVVPELGFVISTRGSQSYVKGDHPASIQPGKRPRVSACPILFEAADGQRIAGGGPGADQQLQAMVQVLHNHLVDTMPLDEAIAAPRIFTHGVPSSSEPHLYFPGKIMVEDAVPEDVFDTLVDLGHRAVRGSASGINRPSVCLVAASADGKPVGAVGDPRRESGQRLKR